MQLEDISVGLYKPVAERVLAKDRQRPCCGVWFRRA
jgi:hypothetical protein